MYTEQELIRREKLNRLSHTNSSKQLPKLLHENR